MNKTYELLKKYEIADPRCGAGVGAGWLPLIEELIQKLITAGWDKDCQQIKEKFGGLRFYIGDATEEVHKLVTEYENKSYEVCEGCGSPGKPRGGGWILTLCDNCDNKRNQRRQ